MSGVQQSQPGLETQPSHSEKRRQQLTAARIMLVHLGAAAEQITKAKLECESFFEKAGAEGSNIAESTVEEFDDCLHAIRLRLWHHNNYLTCICLSLLSMMDGMR